MGKRVAGIDPKALEALKRYGWPGNIRQLRNVIERAVLFSNGEQVLLEEIDPAVRTQMSVATGELKSLDQVEREHIQSVLKSVSGNKSKAAEVLGISRYTLYEKIRKYALE
jgi:transcriptional regulator with PAS, ATPase and Fis domain